VVFLELKFKSTILKIEFSFLLLVAFAVLYGYKNAAQLIFFSLLHESGHFLALLFFGVKPYLINFSFYGMGMKYNDRLSNFQEFIVIFCGPLVNFVLFLIFKNEINLLLFFLNMFPSVPLDGGRLLKILFPEIYRIITYLFLIPLFGISIYILIKYKIFSLLLIAAYLLFFNIFQTRFI